MKTKRIIWVLAHEPYDLFIKAATQFSKDVGAGTNGRYIIDVMSLDDWNKQSEVNKLTTHALDREKVVGLVNNGTIDMATVYVNTLGSIDKNLWVLSMPFLFNDHEHAEKVLDGKIGSELLAGLSRNSNIKGLAFTYSGGFRIIPSVQAIESVKDFYNLTIRTSKNPVAIDTFKSLGANPVSMLIDEFRNAMNNQEVVAGETTYPRFFSMGHHEQSKYINHTEHSLFLTGIVMNSQVWGEMTAEDQAVFAEAAVSAAKIERTESLGDIKRVQQEASNVGIPTLVMSNVERAKFASITKSIYGKYDTFFDNGVLSSITKVH
jgi:TRAP-type C4-dicarboxylate transport system substrate-binding protein